MQSCKQKGFLCINYLLAARTKFCSHTNICVHLQIWRKDHREKCWEKRFQKHEIRIGLHLLATKLFASSRKSSLHWTGKMAILLLKAMSVTSQLNLYLLGLLHCCSDQDVLYLLFCHWSSPVTQCSVQWSCVLPCAIINMIFFVRPAILCECSVRELFWPENITFTLFTTGLFRYLHCN